MAIGYACIHLGSEDTRLTSLTLANASADNLRRVIDHNLHALLAILQYNDQHDIRLFRISSDLIPFASHPAMQLDWRAEFREMLSRIGAFIISKGMRVSMHPGQYTVLNSPNASVVKNAVADLQYHSDLLDALHCDTTHKIILHIGGVYGDKPLAMRRFIDNFRALDERVRARLVIENDDVSYTAEDVMCIAEQTGLPVVFDSFHHLLNHTENSPSAYEWIGWFRETWRARNGKQKIHYSQGNPAARGGAHSESIDVKEFLSFYQGLKSQEVDIMLEVKDKNLSAVKCILATMPSPSIHLLEEEWARYKYLVLSQSAAIYGGIRTLLKNKAEPQVVPFYAFVDEAIALEEDKGAQINAAQHVWGYVNAAASDAEKRQFHRLIEAYQAGSRSRKAVKGFLFRMAKQQNVPYLLESLYFYLS